MKNLTITRLSDPGSGPGERRYRIEGGDLAPEFAALLRAEETPWCEVTLRSNDTLSSYGGTVWPLAWPALFERVNAGTYYERTAVAAESRALFDLAVRAA